MKTIMVNELGSLDSVQVVDIESPALIAGHVRINVLACGLNYVDALLIEGRYQVKPPVPFRPGSEIVGRITEVASDVTHLKVGQRVFVPIGVGGFSEEVMAHASRVIPIPDSMTDGQGATFMQSYLTAWFAFAKRSPIVAGETVLVLGAGGGVGLAAVDVAVSRGARVIVAASSAEKRQLGLDRGAFAAIDVLNEDIKTRARELSGGGIDMVYDPVGGNLAEPCLRALAPFGRYLVVGFVAGIPKLPANIMLLLNRTVVGVDWGAWVGKNPEENVQMTIEVLKEIDEGRLNPVEPVSYSMSKVADALRDMQNRKVVGKVSLVPTFD